jgi:hypothetical protein
MEGNAVVQAAARLAKAEKSLGALKAASNFDEAEEAWSDFLLAASGIYAKLEQGAKGSRKSAGWFGRQKKARKDNPVLNYLHRARNSDEHGIRRVTKRTSDNYWQGRQLKFGERRKEIFHKVDKETMETVGAPIPALIKGPFLELTTVHDDRYGDSCPADPAGPIWD